MIKPPYAPLKGPCLTELRLLISGAGGRLDVADLAQSAMYSGGYTADHPTVRALWEAGGRHRHSFAGFQGTSNGGRQL
jgi:ubiquitin-protein ligase E3 C